jgi:CRP/FNR family transcriptional regulator, cyclic AMP receptor protein
MATYLEAFRDLPVQNISAGETVIEQGTNTGRLFILISGKVEIVKDGQTVAASGQAGDIFGDISALLNLPHTTSVRAVRNSSFYIVTEARTFLEQNPVVCMHLCELLARRLVSVTDYLVNLKHQFAGHDHLGMVDEVLDSLIHRHPRTRIAPRSSTVHIPEIPD